MATVTSAGSGHLRNSLTDGQINGSVSLGELLRGAREARGLTLEWIARETKIPQRHLEALEHGDLSASPAGFYQRAELRAYARAVGVDTEVAIAKLQSALKPAEEPNTSPEIPKSRTSTRPRTLGMIALALVAVAVGAAALGRTISQPAPASAVTSDPVPAVTPAVTPAVGGGDAPPDTAVSSTDRPAPAAPSAPAIDAAVQSTTAAPETILPVGSVTELVVTTQPAGARVTVNGIGRGISPVTIPHLPPGEKRIRVSMEGYASQERVLRLGERQRQTLDIRLAAAP